MLLLSPGVVWCRGFTGGASANQPRCLGGGMPPPWEVARSLPAGARSRYSPGGLAARFGVQRPASPPLRMRVDVRAESGADPEGAGPVYLPPAPDLGGLRPAGSWNPASLAFLGDSVWELWVRRHYFYPPRRPQNYSKLVRDAVRAEAQAGFVDILATDEWWTEEEQRIYKWGYNSSTATSGQPKRLKKEGMAGVYRSATGLEVLAGYLYLTDTERLAELMEKVKLGGSEGEST